MDVLMQEIDSREKISIEGELNDTLENMVDGMRGSIKDIFMERKMRVAIRY